MAYVLILVFQRIHFCGFVWLHDKYVTYTMYLICTSLVQHALCIVQPPPHPPLFQVIKLLCPEASCFMNKYSLVLKELIKI